MELPCITLVSVGDEFMFPTHTELEKDADRMTDLGGLAVVQFVRTVFKKIALPFNTLGNACVIQIQAWFRRRGL